MKCPVCFDEMIPCTLPYHGWNLTTQSGVVMINVRLKQFICKTHKTVVVTDRTDVGNYGDAIEKFHNAAKISPTEALSFAINNPDRYTVKPT